MTDDLDTLRPDVAEAVKGADAAFHHEGLFAEPYWQTIRAELLRLAGDNAAMREELLHVPSRSEWHQVNECAEKAEDAIFQISARLGEQREPNMDDADWHTQLIARAQFLANAEAELAALKARIDGSRHAFLGPNMDRITFLAEDIGPVGKYALVKVEE